MKLATRLTKTAIVLTLMTPLASYAQNRITGRADPGKRCTQPLVDDKCEKYRLKAKNNGCISEEEYQTLKNYGSYPSCEDREDDGKLTLTGWCPCGCFHPDTLISIFNKSSNNFEEASAGNVTSNHSNYQLVHLDEVSTMTNFAYRQTDIRTPTYGPESHPLIVIKAANGAKLKLTDKHPVLTARGEMVQAGELKVEDGLIAQDGTPLNITAIEKEKYEGNVVNFMVDSSLDRKLEHVIFAEQLAVGDLAWQSSLEDEQHQVFLRQ